MVIVRSTGLSSTGSSSSGGRSGASDNRGSSSRGSSRSRRSRRGSLAVMPRTPNTRNSDIVRVDLESEVLESVRVANSLSGVGLRKGKDTGVLVGAAVVLDDALADLGDVQEAVQKVGCPVEVCGAVGDVVSEHAHALQGTAEDIRGVADHGLGRRVGAAPVTGPVCQCC